MHLLWAGSTIAWEYDGMFAEVFQQMSNEKEVNRSNRGAIRGQRWYKFTKYW